MEGDYLRRKEAASYLLNKYGFGASATLAKGAVTGDTPEYHKAGRIVLYRRESLDKWATSKISGPLTSTSNTAAACLGGGPAFRKAGPALLPEPAALHERASSKTGLPQASTSDTGPA